MICLNWSRPSKIGAESSYVADQADLIDHVAAPSHGSYSFPSSSFVESDGFRIDAAHFNPEFLGALKSLYESGMRIERLGDITRDVFIPPRFKRVYVEDSSYGVPFIQGGQIVNYQLPDLKYLSRSIDRLERWTIEAGWLLVSCSGTIGRITVCPPEWDGWAASQHVLRIVPDEERCSSGYLSLFLASPLGQVQMTANSYGAVVDELTEEQAKSILVPLPELDVDKELIRTLDAKIRESLGHRSAAISLWNSAVDSLRPPHSFSQESNWFSFPVHQLQNGDHRFDAGNFNPSLFHALGLLAETETVPLGDVAEVFMPGRFKRVYVGQDHGVPFIQGSHLPQFQAEGVKYLSKEHQDVDNLQLEEGWLLVTRSGTVGRVTLCPQEWDGWAASEHIIRIIVNEERCPPGYLCTFLASPLGQAQLSASIYGAVVDELTEEQVRQILVPVPRSKSSWDSLWSIDSTMRKATELRSKAVAIARICESELSKRLGVALHVK